MKAKLYSNYISKAARLAELDRQIAEVEEILKTPARTVEDIIRHIQLLKEKQELL